MEIDIHHVARLARLHLEPDEAVQLAVQLGRILDYVGELAELDTDDVSPTSHAVPLTAPLRADVVGEHLGKAATFANAPEHDGVAFVVPRVV